MKKLYILIAATFFLASCGDSTKKEESNSEQETIVYTIDHSRTSFQWEAYKFNERKGVKGTFDSITITPKNETGSLEEIINGCSFEININSTNSGDATRDPKIIAHFFGSMMNTDVVKGSIIEYNAVSETEIDAVVAITMNDKTVNTPAKIMIMDKVIQLKSSIDMANWEASSSIDSLNTVCKELHTGSDGVSKLWPDVSITVNTSFKEAAVN